MATTEKMIALFVKKANQKKIIDGRTPKERFKIFTEKRRLLKYAEVLHEVIS